MIVFDCQQGTPAWDDCRRGRATASEFGSILAKASGRGEGVRAAYMKRLIGDRIGVRRDTPRYSSGAMRRGHEREPGARDAYEIHSGILIRQVGFCLHDRLAAGASPDGLSAEGGLEIKSPEESAHLEAWLTRQVPTVYVPQVQGNMWICARRWWDFVSWNPDFPPHLQLVVIRAVRDERYIDRLRTEVELFLQEVDDAVAKLAA